MLRRALYLSGPVLMMLVVAWVDWVTGPLVAISPFYLLVIVLAARRHSRLRSIVYAIVAGVIYLAVDLYTAPEFVRTIYPYWRAVAVTIGFGLVAYMIPALVEERRRLAQSETLLIRQRGELQELNRRLIVTLEELSAAKDRLLGELVAEHTAAIRGLQEELERGLSLFRAIRGESERLHGN